MTTVWIYVDTNKEVGDVDHLKVFATIRKASCSATRSWSESWAQEKSRKAIRAFPQQ
jgi:hypothetical protein